MGSKRQDLRRVRGSLGSRCGLARAGVLVAGVLVGVVSGAPLVWADTVTVEPSWENAPWAAKVQTILNVTGQVGLVCCVLAFLLGGAAMAIGRVVGSYQAGHRGMQLVLGGGGGALIIASAASIVSWLIS